MDDERKQAIETIRIAIEPKPPSEEKIIGLIRVLRPGHHVSDWEIELAYSIYYHIKRNMHD